MKCDIPLYGNSDLIVKFLCWENGVLQRSGSSQGGRNRGDRGDWSVVRSRKWKATEQEYRGHDRFQESDWQGGTTRVEGQI